MEKENHERKNVFLSLCGGGSSSLAREFNPPSRQTDHGSHAGGDNGHKECCLETVHISSQYERHLRGGEFLA